MKVLALILLPLSFAGCAGWDSADGPSYYHVALHAPVFRWDDARQEFSGEFLLSHVGPDWANDVYDVYKPTIQVHYSSTRPLERFDFLGTWELEYTTAEETRIARGETVRFGFAVRPVETYAGNVGTVTAIITYEYDFEAEDGEKAFLDGRYENFCLDVSDGTLRQESRGDCKPRADSPASTRHQMLMSGYGVPPVEAWDRWEDPPAQVQRVKDFLAAFDGTGQRDYNGTLYCGDCRAGGAVAGMRPSGP